MYQDLALCNNLTAAANVFLGREICARSVCSAYSITLPWRSGRQPSFKSCNPRRVHETSSSACREDKRQAVAIARTRLAEAKLILMDEPTAAISVRQVAQVLALIRRLKEQGHSVILISHRMPDVFTTCDRVIVLRRGRKVADKPVGSSSPEEVTGLITGASRFRRKSAMRPYGSEEIGRRCEDG